ncbi:MAG: chemotaxis protein CheW [Xanthobacteraceae bacterium]|jgi:purine-binding chemotaxis protein CheW
MTTASNSPAEPLAPTPADWRTSDPARAASTCAEFISFAIGDEQYGVDIMAVREIKGWSSVTQLPNQPEYMRGVLNLRGIMVPIVDLRCRFGQGPTDATAMHVVIVVQVDAKTVGLLADRVLDIVAVDASQIQPVPQVSRSARADFLAGLVTVEATLIALINLAQLLSAQPEIAAVATV